MKRYANGDVVVKERMEDEEWYCSFSTMLELGMFVLDHTKILELFNSEHVAVFGVEYSNPEQAIRWAKHIAETNKELKEQHPEWEEWSEV